MCTQKLTSSQLNLPHGTEQKRIIKKLKPKNGDAQKKRSGHEVHGVSKFNAKSVSERILKIGWHLTKL